MREVAVNERGLRIGEDHPNAKYTNGEIEMVLSLRDEGKSYGEICRLVEMPKSTVRNIIKGQRRCQYPAAWKRVPTNDDRLRIEKLRADGMSWAEVGTALGLSNAKTGYDQLCQQLEESEHEQ
ncbi:MAG: hypothetical protein ACYC5U_11700 [Rhodocyclaceae bacterium]